MSSLAPDFDAFIDAWRTRWQDQHVRDEVAVALRRAAAEALVPRIAAALVAELGVSRVWLVGSLARGELRLDSDIDLAVEGLAPERWLDAERLAERVAGPGFVVEIVPIESAKPRFRDAVAREGRLVHGQ